MHGTGALLRLLAAPSTKVDGPAGPYLLRCGQQCFRRRIAVVNLGAWFGNSCASAIALRVLPRVSNATIDTGSGNSVVKRTDDRAPYVVDAAGLRSLHFGPARVQSRMLLRDPALLVFDYTCLMMGFLLFLPRPRRIGLIGLGGGSLLKFCHRYVAGSRCEAVERDARVIALRDTFALPRDERRCRIRLGDGVNFIKSETGVFDVILLDGYDESGMPARLRSRSFVAACRKALRADGLLVVNLDSTDPGRDAFLANVRQVFDGDVLCVLDEDGGNCVVFAGRRLKRRVGEIRRPAAVDRAGWAQLVPAVLRIRAAQTLVEG